MIRFLKKLFLLVLLLGLVAGAVFLAKKMMVRPEKPAAIVGKVVRADLVQRVSFAGTVSSKRRSIITAPYTGYVKQLHVRVGDSIKKGDALVTIASSLDSFEPAHPLRAPISGVVTFIRKEEGEFVKESDAQDYVLRIDDMAKFIVQAKVPEIDRTKVSIAQEAVIKISAISNLPFHGVVRRVSIAPEEKQQGFSFGGKSQVEYEVLIEIKENDARLKPGMSAIVDVIAASKTSVLTLGHEFVQSEEEKFFVTLKDGSRRDIKIGLQNDEGMEIQEGLNEGDEVQQIEFAP